MSWTYLIVAFTLALLSVATLFASDDTGSVDSPLIRCWQKDISPNDYLLFKRDHTCGIATNGHVRIMHAIFSPNKIDLSSMGQSIQWDFAIDGGILSVTFVGGITRTYHPVTPTPDVFDLKPLSLGHGTLTPGRVHMIHEQLVKRMADDQAVRTDPQKNSGMQAVDSDNTTWLKILVQEVGWIDVIRFDPQTSNAAFILVQHSGDLPLMLATLPEIKKDVKAKCIDGQAYAMLYDRMNIDLGGKQRYGTQIGKGQRGSLVLLPLADKDRVDQFRKELGLIPLSDYLDFIKKQYGVKEVKVSDD